MRIKIETPVTDHTGLVGHIAITDGVGIADSETHAAELSYCHRNGYKLTAAETGEPYDPTATDALKAEVVTLRQTRENLGFTAEQIAEMEADDTAAGEDKMPRRSGSAEAWRAYAVAHGMTADAAADLTRDQLVERFTSTEENDS